LQDVKKDNFFGGDEGFSNFKKSPTINTTSSMTKSPSLKKKAAAAAKKKTGKLDIFQSNFTKIMLFIVLYVVAGLCWVPAPPFISLFLMSNVIATAW
jgi:hypothetical protein